MQKRSMQKWAMIKNGWLKAPGNRKALFLKNSELELVWVP